MIFIFGRQWWQLIPSSKYRHSGENRRKLEHFHDANKEEGKNHQCRLSIFSINFALFCDLRLRIGRLMDDKALGVNSLLWIYLGAKVPLYARLVYTQFLLLLLFLHVRSQRNYFYVLFCSILFNSVIHKRNYQYKYSWICRRAWPFTRLFRLHCHNIIVGDIN